MKTLMPQVDNTEGSIFQIFFGKSRKITPRVYVFFFIIVFVLNYFYSWQRIFVFTDLLDAKIFFTTPCIKGGVRGDGNNFK